MIPFIVEGDHVLMVLVDDAGKKKPLCLAQIAFKAARESGLPEFTFVDHNMEHAPCMNRIGRIG